MDSEMKFRLYAQSGTVTNKVSEVFRPHYTMYKY